MEPGGRSTGILNPLRPGPGGRYLRDGPTAGRAERSETTMKKGGILNPAICSLLAELGHMDELLIVDAGYALPPDGHVIDLTLTPGIPRFLDVLRAVAEELVIEAITVASEIEEFSPKLYLEVKPDRRRCRRR